MNAPPPTPNAFFKGLFVAMLICLPFWLIVFNVDWTAARAGTVITAILLGVCLTHRTRPTR